MCYAGLHSMNMRTISQRELRNDNAAVVRGVVEGETYVITRHGVPVARLVPIGNDSDLRIGRPAKSRLKYAGRKRLVVDAATADVLGDLRGDR